ncbi:hypothetical protein ONZ45_g14283 [Pleurotus djamor]|nr:hypothetical protein ONZ45_g14283 [Pleurotus djamor]
MTHPYEFKADDADIVLVSNEPQPTHYRVHRCILSAGSPFFRTMFSLPKPKESTEAIPLISMSESSKVLDALLRFLYPIPDPQLEILEDVVAVLGAAIKYEFDAVVSALRKHLISPHFLQEYPIRIFAVACRYDLDFEAKVASRYTLRFNVLDCPISDELKFISAYSYHQLLDLHRCRSRAAQEVLTLASLDNLKCALCTGSVHSFFRTPKWWKEFEKKAKERLATAPTTDGLFEVDFLAQCARDAECQRCFESVCMSYGTLQDIKARIDALPATI